ncbi:MULTISPECIES: lipopolysaccharide assembly protein LapA domain-containing protein [Streptomyces]|uniref:Lipopolysaccharide assembly protein LapA domain-containing protein n=1 Tax=Streptomyces solicathayae TaxID=3081768 RepID=A0ABZ0LQ79_9ACTN|nr:lipopolysaccharide assembly protein LapA domain-containing protein [Streptomyces sp. HUAS YS2]WOX20953.1 lipopolysaccharide assembly protein LapA domain-containing protein [Streptomyces sp. HUAS YS2]
MARNAAKVHEHSTLTVQGRAVRLRTIGFVVLAALAIWFIAANTGSITIRMWVADVTLPLWTVLAGTLLVGIVLGLLIAYRRARR